MKIKNLILISIAILCIETLFGQPTTTTLRTSYAGGTYFIKSRTAQKYLSVQAQSIQPGAVILLADPSGSKGQKFTFQDGGDGYYFIRTNGAGLYLTLVRNEFTVTGGAVGSGISYQLKQQNLYTSALHDVEEIWPNSGSQKWKILPSTDSTCVLITNKNLLTNVIVPASGSNNISYITQTTAITQHWLLKQASVKENPDTSSARRGLVNECIYVPRAYSRSGDAFNLARTLPQWRPVGDNNIPSNDGYRPANVCETVEGRVTKATVGFEDNPINHYTHDFIFDVIPDPDFNYILAKKGNQIQDRIHIEWETGIAQGEHKTKNIASEPNRRGESCGFYSKGHQRQNIIWNWPSIHDWVHVEGQWVFDLGHKLKTEIHPPRFVAIQRYLPEKYSPSNSANYYYATRCDLYASADGNALTNNRGLHSFVQRIKMSEKNYYVTFKHDIPRPNQSAQLRVAIINHNGNSFTTNLIIRINSNGTADKPTPNVEVAIPWFSANISDDATLAKTLFLYWEDAPSHGASLTYINSLRRLEVTLDYVKIQKNIEEGGADAGEARMFANIAGKWIFLNEFCEPDDILSDGLGNAIDSATLRHKLNRFGTFRPIPSDYPEKFLFNFNQSFEVYVPRDKLIRCYVTGWEDDYLGGHFGELMSPYLSCEEAKEFVDKYANWRAAHWQNGCDDPLGYAEIFINPGIYARVNPITSLAMGGDDCTQGGAGIFRTQFTVRR